jgi:hypothetical protein
MNLLALVSVIPFIFEGAKSVIYHADYIDGAASAVAIILAVIAFTLLYIIFSIVLPLATTEAINEVHAGKIPEVGHVYKKAFSHFIQYLLVIFFVVVVSLGGYLLFVIPGIVAGIYVMFAMYTYYFEGKKGMDALVLSAWYVRGLWWDIFARKIFLALIVLFASLVFMGVVGTVTLALGFGFGVFSFLFNLFLFMIVVPFSLTFSYLLYKDAKSVKAHHPLPTAEFQDEAERTFIILLVIASLAALVFFFLNAVPAPMILK